MGCRISRPPPHDFLRGLGADQLIDYRTQDYTEVLRDAPVDVVLETPGGGNPERSFGVLRRGGVQGELAITV